jgi:hypothetical protein
MVLLDKADSWADKRPDKRPDNKGEYSVKT